MKKKQKTKKRSTLTLRLNPTTIHLVQRAKEITGEKTGSGAIITCLKVLPMKIAELDKIYALLKKTDVMLEIEQNKSEMMKRAINNYLPSKKK